MTGVELKEFSLLYLVMNNLILLQANIHLIENIKLLQELETGKLSLYDLANDIGETRDLADQHPGKVKSLLMKLKSWQKHQR